MPWIIPEHKLDPQQREFKDRMDFNRENIWIKGFPGSGKSVLLSHTLDQIKRRTPSASVAVVVFTHSLIEMFKEAFYEMGYNVEVMTYFQFMKTSKRYDYILSDEVQDLVPSVLNAMKQRADHVIVAGDENQSIYEKDPLNREFTVSPSQIRTLLSAKPYELTIIHRLSSSIINVIQRFIPDMNILSSKRDMTKTSTEVRLCEANGTSEEVKYIMMNANKASLAGDTSVILLPTQKDIVKFVNAALAAEGKSAWVERFNKYGKYDFADMNSYLAEKGINLKYVGNGTGTFSSEDNKVVIMTYHSAKGLDFENVFIPFVNSSLFIVANEKLSKTLFMVAMTRSRKNLYITYSGYKHPYLNTFASQCCSIDVHNALSSGGSSSRGSGSIYGV